MDAPQNNLDSLFGSDNTFSHSIVTIGSIMLGNSPTAPAPQTQEEQPPQPLPQPPHSVLYILLGGIGIVLIGIIAVAQITTTIHTLTSGSTTYSIITLIVTIVIVIIIIGVMIRSFRKQYLPIPHQQHVYTIRKRGIKILGLSIFTRYESEETNEQRIIFCFFGIPFLRKTATGYYLIGFIPLTFMLGLLFGTLFISGLVIYKQSIQSPSQQRANERKVSPIPIIPIPTPTIDIAQLKDREYVRGRTAYERQDWPLAAQAFKRVWEIDPTYQELESIGSATYFNWAMDSLTSPQSVKTSQQYLAEALRFNPNHHLATQLSATLNSYQTGEQALRDGNYTVAIEQLNQTLEQFHADQEFNALVSSLSVVEKLYQAYMLEAGTALELGDLEAAHEAYRQAILLKDQDIKLDVSEAEAGFSASKPKRLYFQKYADNAVDPTCFAVHIRGVTTGGWFVTVDGLGNRGNLDSVGNTNVCGLIASQEVTFTVYNAAGKAVLGGGGIPTRGGNLMSAELR